MRFNLRLAFVLITTLAILLAIFRRPLAALLETFTGFHEGLFWAFLNPFRWMPWLFGAEWDYYEGSGSYLSTLQIQQQMTGGENLAMALGATLMLVVTGVLVVFSIVAFFKAVDWATRSD